METKEITKNLNLEQKEAVTYGDGPVLIVAGAGTGKTTVITQRIAWLILEGKAKPEEILAVTFTEKAAAEMEERVDQLLPYGYIDLWISTFHSFCEKILKQHALDIGLSNDFQILDDTAQWLLVRENLDRFNLDYYRPLGNPTKFIHALLKHFSRAKDEVIRPQDYLEYAEKLKINLDGMESTKGKVSVKAIRDKKKKIEEEKNDDNLEVKRINEVAEAYHVYQQLLLENNAFDFGDLINYTLKLFQDRPKILKRYQEQFKYVLVDEFQDTNWAQYQLIKLLAEPQNNVTVVGDDDQAIYRFRGASISNILEFKSDYPESREIVLTQNYRSAQIILDAAYDFIQHNNPNRLECKLNESEEILAQAKKKGVDVKRFKKIDKKLVSPTKIKGAIEHLSFKTASQEVDGVIKKILELKKADKDLLWSDFAILVRANSHAKPFNSALARVGIPFQFLALRGLYSKDIILDVLAYFNLLDNYHESPAVWRVLNFPVFNISNQDLVELSHQAYYKGWSLFESLQKAALNNKLSPKTVEEVSRILTLIERHSHLAREKTVGELLVTFLTDIGYLEYLKDHEDTVGREGLDYLRQFYNKIKAFEQESDPATLKQFMQKIRLELEAGDEGSLQLDMEAGPDVVRVMTVHGSKGLEFKYVFIVNMVQLRFPTPEREDAIEIPDELIKEVLPEGDVHLQEERRLFYVAMTRAKTGLFFTSAQDYGGARRKKMSRFLDEIGYKSEVNEDKKVIKEKIDDIKYNVTKKEKVFYLPIPKKFPFSQLSSFDKCPLQYKYAYILKIPTFGKPSFSFGSTIHNTLQKFFEKMVQGGGGQVDLFGESKNSKEPKIPSLEVLLDLYENCWIDAWYPDPDIKKKYKEKGRKILKEYYQVIKETKPQPLRLESPFVIKVGPYSISGRVDRIDQIADGVEIIDYKTGQAKTEAKDDDKNQLLIYQLAAEESFGLKPTKLTYYYIEDGKPVSFVGSVKDKNDIKERIIEIVDKIKQSDFSPTPGWPCKFCDYRNICQYRE
ncbi:MAG: ATP-dependent DNA helicase [Patescibacteria group bacterium]|jgi:DNA helicase-2/ATP-dependent DNA helicase PcrA